MIDKQHQSWWPCRDMQSIPSILPSLHVRSHPSIASTTTTRAQCGGCWLCFQPAPFPNARGLFLSWPSPLPFVLPRDGASAQRVLNNKNRCAPPITTAKTSGAEASRAGLVCPRWAVSTRALLAHCSPVACCKLLVFLTTSHRQSIGTAVVGYSMASCHIALCNLARRHVVQMFVVMTGNDPISDSQIKQDREAKKSEMGLPHWTKTNQVLDPRPTQPIFWGVGGINCFSLLTHPVPEALPSVNRTCSTAQPLILNATAANDGAHLHQL